MKAIITVAVFSFLSSSIFAQDITGQWKGVLDVQGTQLHLIFHVTKTNNVYTTTMDSPDQGAKGIAVASTTFIKPSVKFDASNIGAAFEGVLSDKIIKGDWKQSGQSFPLVLTKEPEPAAK